MDASFGGYLNCQALPCESYPPMPPGQATDQLTTDGRRGQAVAAWFNRPINFSRSLQDVFFDLIISAKSWFQWLNFFVGRLMIWYYNDSVINEIIDFSPVILWEF